MDDPQLPPGIGPHEGRELELMLAGEKPLAMFSDVDGWDGFPDADFAPHVAAGRIVMRETCRSDRMKGLAIRSLYYALPDEEWRIERMMEIERGFRDGGIRNRPALETEIGRLLGYSEADIRAFLAHIGLA